MPKQPSRSASGGSIPSQLVARGNILVCYDVNTETKEGRARLRRVAKWCKNFGQRVQYSVFECSVTQAQRERLREKLLEIIDEKEDNLRIYTLGGNREECVEWHGRNLYVDFTRELIY